MKRNNGIRADVAAEVATLLATMEQLHQQKEALRERCRVGDLSASEFKLVTGALDIFAGTAQGRDTSKGERT